MKEQKWVIGIVVALMAMGGIFFSLSNSAQPKDTSIVANITAFGQHLKDEGVKFYGAEWCPHCQNQKKMLGDGGWESIYVECSVKNSQSQAKECEDAKIESYPTWVFKDGTRKTGEISLDELEQITGYKKPATVSTSTPVAPKEVN